MNKCLVLAFWNLKTKWRKKSSRTCHSYYYSKHAWEEHKPDEKGFSSIKLNSSENIQNTCFKMNVVLKLWFSVTPLLGVCCSKFLIKNLAKYQWLLLIKFFLLQVLAGKLRGLHILDMLSRTSTLIIFLSIADEAGCLRRGWNFHKNDNFSLSSSSPNIKHCQKHTSQRVKFFCFRECFKSINNSKLNLARFGLVGVVLFGWSSGCWHHSQSESHYSSLNKGSESLTRINNYRSWVR